MNKTKVKNKTNNYPSLYEAFELGDRVVRNYKDKHGKDKEYKGIIMAIDEKSIEVYWDTLDGRYRPKNMKITFTNCNTNEIFKGNKDYTPIKKYTY